MVPLPTSVIPSGFTSHALQRLQKVQQGLSPVELVYTAHGRWPFQPGQSVHASRSTLRISVLDSSFNPPTMAHLALANSFPPWSPTATTSTSAKLYDARILLLSVRNADKALKPGDATLVQRLEMMYILSRDIHSSGGESSHIDGNVAIAVIDEPTFVGKSSVLLRFLRERVATLIECSTSFNSTSHTLVCPVPKLTFPLGFDTLARIFAPRYYPSEQTMNQMLRVFLSPDQEDCRIVCAYRRPASADKAFQETQDKTFEVAHEFISSGRIAFIDIGVEEQTYSSSEVRGKVGTGDESWKRLVPEMIVDYIIRQGLYSGSEKEQ